MVAQPQKRPTIFVVTPVFNEEANLSRYEQEVTRVLLCRPEYEFKVLLVDDGSSDRSWEMIREICARKPCFQGIRLSRNYGAHVALSAGFANSNGDAVATLACDLQDPPEVILEFLSKWQKGASIVWGRRRSRQEGLLRAFCSRVFFELLSRLAMPRESKFSTGSFLLADQKVVQCFNQFQERNRITFAIVAWTGFNQDVVEYDRKLRQAGRSKWNFSQMIKTTYDAFIGFSVLPVRAMTVLGIGVFFVALGLLVYLVLAWVDGHPAPGWTSQMLALSFFFGVQFLLMGIMGEYLYRIYAEVVRRPLYFISEVTSEQNEII